MRIQDLHVLPKLRDGWSYLYVEHCKIDQEARAIAIHDQSGKVPVPCANLALLMLGPGVSITHAAISVLADHGCLVAWSGEEGVRFYAVGMGETRNASNFLHQAKLWADDELRMKVVRKMYQMRFSENFDHAKTIQQLRGIEGVRVRETYARAARETGIAWTGRNYKRDGWDNADPVNRALSTSNACLYGICHAGIVSAGFSPTLGFIHTGKMLSFVYDVADLYKTDFAVPVAFHEAAQEQGNLERRVRIACRDRFVSGKLLERIIPDIQSILHLTGEVTASSEDIFAHDPAKPSSLWDPEMGNVDGGCNYPLQINESEAGDGGADS